MMMQRTSLLLGLFSISSVLVVAPLLAQRPYTSADKQRDSKLFVSDTASPVTLAQRIGHTDPSKYTRSRSHNSAGDMACELLVPPTAMDVNLNFMHRCQIMPGGGVGHHFHNNTEEMFIVFDGQAEFTIDGRTSVLKGTVGAPVRMGHSHGIYNPSDKPLEFMNIYRGGTGTVKYRRALDADVFLTNWAYVDHLLIPAGASEGLHRHKGVEEIYYVLNGDGQVQVNGETAEIHKGDGVPIRFNEAHSFTNNGKADLELMIVGISAQKNVLDTELGGIPKRP
jgi:mannose-6-phosphate isomerase-like protein (cupin superfamily)